MFVLIHIMLQDSYDVLTADHPAADLKVTTILDKRNWHTQHFVRKEKHFSSPTSFEKAATLPSSILF